MKTLFVILLISIQIVKASVFEWNFDDFTNKTHGIAGNGFHDGNSTLVVNGSESLNIPLNKLTMGTISVWFRMDILAAPSNRFILEYGANTTPFYTHFDIEVGHNAIGNNKLYSTWIRNGIPLCFDSGVNLQTNIWYNFVLVVGSNFNTGYLNGYEMTNRHYNYGNTNTTFFFSQLTTNGNTNMDLSFGRDWLGSIDEFQVDSRVWSSSDAKQYFDTMVNMKISIDREKVYWKAYVGERFEIYTKTNLSMNWILLTNIMAMDETPRIKPDFTQPSMFYRVRRK